MELRVGARPGVWNVSPLGIDYIKPFLAVSIEVGGVRGVRRKLRPVHQLLF